MSMSKRLALVFRRWASRLDPPDPRLLKALGDLSSAINAQTEQMHAVSRSLRAHPVPFTQPEPPTPGTTER